MQFSPLEGAYARLHTGRALLCTFCVSLLSHTLMLPTRGIGNFMLPSSEVIIMGLSRSSALISKSTEIMVDSLFILAWFLGNLIKAKRNLVNILQVLNKMLCPLHW